MTLINTLSEAVPEDEILYLYAAINMRCTDGDSGVMEWWDKGAQDFRKNKEWRLFGVNCFETSYRPKELRGDENEEQWEKHKAKGREASDYVKGLLEGKRVMIKTHKDQDGTFNRLLVDVFIPTDTIDGHEEWNDYAYLWLNPHLIEVGYAVKYGDDFPTI